MSSGLSQAAPGGARAITIPLSSPYRLNDSSMTGRGTQSRRSRQFNRIDSDTGHASSSSIESDWPSSSDNTPKSIHYSTPRFQTSLASPSNTMHLPSGAVDSPPEHQRKDKQRAVSSAMPPNTLPNLFTPTSSALGPSMLSSSAYKSVSLNTHRSPDSNEPARLITYTKHSQGFTWNDELFLPSYMLGRHRYRGHGSCASRRYWNENDEDDTSGDFDEEGEACPVTDIFVTDEEAAAMMP